MIFTKKMKRLLITSAVLALIGIVLCVVAFAAAKNNDIELLSQTQNDSGEYVYTYEFDASLIKKVSLEISYAEVKIVGASDSAKIELINYPIDNFGITVSATTVALEEKSALDTLFSLNFDGLRNYYNSLKMASKNRSVNIYLPQDCAVKLMNIDVYSGDIAVGNIHSYTDFEIEIGYGSLIMEDIISSGELAVKIAEGNLDIKDSEIYSHTSAIALGYESLTDSTLTEINADIAKGYFKYETGGEDLLSSVLRLKSDNGRVRFGGDIYENGSFSQGMEYSGVSGVVQTIINVHLGEGNIMITE